MANNINIEEEPTVAPKPDVWYDLTLGPSFSHHHPSSKFCTLRYEFKPASVDKNRPGSLHKRKDNRVTVEFQNNQHGKPKVMFEGITEDYKENDAVLFFDGETFRLEQLHRAVKRLRYVRQHGESAATSVGPAVEFNPLPVGNTGSHQFPEESATQVEVENIDIGNPEYLGGKPEKETAGSEVEPASTSTALPEPTNYESSEENLDIMGDEDESHPLDKEENQSRLEVHRGIDINLPHQDDGEEDEIADVDVSDDEVNAGCNAAEALRAQVAGEREDGSSGSTTTTSSSSGGGTSSSSSSESSSGSECQSSDEDSVISV
ncbi:ell-associated factor Eaf-like [Punica granatum]|uniref:Ell-associated factor Eaf-like n=2 Tax=Punica granatum TaxID=22663 RepID=A0A6P8DUG1_PUNGR|nr:ell-associated factor Eaf-like [Punica granatum]PKI56777.1 hypothetical protein CRG98_022838 [Punica granatum]